MNGKEETQEIELRAPEVDEVLSRQPAWITRYGLIVLTLTLIMLFILSWVISFPDILTSPALITSQNPPAVLIARADGKISGLYVHDKQPVLAGQLLAILENPADFREVAFLDSLIRNFLQHKDTALFTGELEAGHQLSLGELQTSYAALASALSGYSQFRELRHHPSKIAAVNEELMLTRQYEERLRRQRNLLEKDYLIGRNQYTRDSLLYRDKVIATADLEKSETSLIQKRFALEESRLSLSNAGIKLSQLQQQLIDLKTSYREEEKRLLTQLDESIGNMNSEIRQWEQRYVLRSPFEGRIVFNQFWTTNQNVKSGDKVLTVIPEEGEEIQCRISLPTAGAGKVKPGQRVNIKVANYPFLEYGMLQGKVKGIAEVAVDGFFFVEVELAGGLVTNYGKTLPAGQELSGTAEIITEDIRFLERILNPLRHLFRR